jgi:hypothetical protein
MEPAARFRHAMKRLRRHLGVIALAVTYMLLTGCASYQQLNSGELSRIDAVLKPGDEVRIVTRSGEQIDLKITSIDANAIAGEDRRVLVFDVLTVETKRFNKRRAWIIAGVVAGVLLTIDYDDGGCDQCFPVFP